MGPLIGLVRTNEAIVIAADSRAVNGAGQKEPDTCKIHVVGNFFFAIHGIGDKDIVRGVIQSLAGSGDLRSKARHFREAFTDTIVARLRLAPLRMLVGQPTTTNGSGHQRTFGVVDEFMHEIGSKRERAAKAKKK